MLVTMILITALLAGSAVLVSMQMQSTRSADVQKTKTTALYCAEAGLAGVEAVVTAHYSQWNASLGTNVEPSWLASIDHDIDNDGTADFTITLRDNADETTTADDPTHDNDLSVFIVSSCTKYSDMPASVTELVRSSGGGNCYQAQLGGCGGNANAN